MTMRAQRFHNKQTYEFKQKSSQVAIKIARRLEAETGSLVFSKPVIHAVPKPRNGDTSDAICWMMKADYGEIVFSREKSLACSIKKNQWRLKPVDDKLELCIDWGKTSDIKVDRFDSLDVQHFNDGYAQAMTDLQIELLSSFCEYDTIKLSYLSTIIKELTKRTK